MPSLLELLSAQRQGIPPLLLGDPKSQAGALLGQRLSQGIQQPAAAPQANPLSGILSGPQAPQTGPGTAGGVFGRLFGGADDPNLTPEQNDAARRQALIQAGIATILSQRGGIEAAAEGLAFGQQAGAASRANALAADELRRADDEQQRTAALRSNLLSTVDATDRGALAQATLILASQGDFEGVGQLVDLAESLPSDQFIQGQRGQLLHFNPTTRSITEIQSPEDLPANRQLSQQGDVTRLVDLDTGGVIAEFDHRKIQSASDLNADIRQAIDLESKLNDRFFRQTADYQEAFRRGRDALSAPENRAGDETMVIGFQKMLDAASVVREGEFNRIYDVGGLQARAELWLNRIRSGGELAAETRDIVRGEIRRLKAALEEDIGVAAEPFIRQANSAGLNASNVVGGMVANLIDNPFSDLVP